MTVNEKIIQYLNYKGISQRSFTIKCSLSDGVLRKNKGLGSIYLKQIRLNYPDLNFNWVLFDEEEMIVKDGYNLNQPRNIVLEQSTVYETMESNCKEQLFILQKKVITLQDKLLKSNEKIEELRS